MLLVRRICVFALLAPLALAVQGWGAELSAGDAVKIIADRLEASQVHDGPQPGLWSEEEQFMGPTTAGMVCAYEWMQNISYYTSAESAASYVLYLADVQGNLLGDEAYGLVRMSQASKSEEPWTTPLWVNVVVDFYESLRDPAYEGSTQAYIRYFDGMDPSTSVFYLAHHAVAANYIGDRDKDLWRTALITWLSYVDDQSHFPVMDLGVATWALAETGNLDDTPVAADGGSLWWEGVKLSDLPLLLLSHQTPQEEPYGGSFYWRFDHTSGGSEDPAAGYTEDAVYGILGLVAASLQADVPDGGMTEAIRWAQAALLQGVDTEGRVFEHLAQQGETRHVFEGEMLQALWSVQQYLDASSESEVVGAVALTE